MSQPLLAYNVWLALPVETRTKLVQLFSIPRTGEVIVQTGSMINGNIGSIVKNDGHAAGDLYAISVEKMQTLLKTDDTDFYKMFNHVVENIDYLVEPKEKEPDVEVIFADEKERFAKLMTEPIKNKGGRPKKNVPKEN